MLTAAGGAPWAVCVRTERGQVTRAMYDRGGALGRYLRRDGNGRGVRAWGVTGAPGVRGRVITSLFDGVTVGLGSRSGWEGVVGRPASGRMGSGLAK